MLALGVEGRDPHLDWAGEAATKGEGDPRTPDLRSIARKTLCSLRTWKTGVCEPLRKGAITESDSVYANETLC